MNKSRQRKTVKCRSCDKEKLHFGLGMCSACLRNHKRKTRPSFYLGTCYSEMSRRVKTYDPKRPNYFGKKKCTREEFINRFIDDNIFLELYKGWQKSNYERGEAPSIDRINDKGDYTLDNLQFIKHRKNAKKDNYRQFIVADKKFYSLLDLSKFIGMDNDQLRHKLKKTNTINGYEIEEVTPKYGRDKK